MSDPTFVAASQEYLRVEVERAFGGFVTTDYTGELAFCPYGHLASSIEETDWTDAAWETVDGHDYLRVLLGVDVTLAVGAYTVYARLTGSTEVPITRAVGQVTIV